MSSRRGLPPSSLWDRSNSTGRTGRSVVGTAIVSYIAERAADQASLDVPVMLMPTFSFGFAQHRLPFGATIGIELSVYLDVITEIGRSLVLGVSHRILYLNVHGGNEGRYGWSVTGSSSNTGWMCMSLAPPI